MAEKPRYQNHPERVRPKTIPREVCLGGKAMAGYSFSAEHGNRIMTDEEARQRHLEFVLQGQDEGVVQTVPILEEPEFRRSTDTPPTKYAIDANQVTYLVESEE